VALIKGGGNIDASASDARGNTYTRIQNDLYNTSHKAVVFTAPVTTAIQSGDAITFTWTGSVTNDISAICVQGQAASSPVDRTPELTTGNGQTGNSTGPNAGGAPDVTSGTLAQANELDIGIMWPDAFIGSFTEDASYTPANGGANPSGSRQLNVACRVVSSTASTSYRPSATTGQWLATIMTVKQAGAAGSSLAGLLTVIGAGQ
jgi:hypothetical protein